MSSINVPLWMFLLESELALNITLITERIAHSWLTEVAYLRRLVNQTSLSSSLTCTDTAFLSCHAAIDRSLSPLSLSFPRSFQNSSVLFPGSTPEGRDRLTWRDIADILWKYLRYIVHCDTCDLLENHLCIKLCVLHREYNFI